MGHHTLHVTKASGELALFSPHKLQASLHRAGATPEMSAAILEAITPRLTSGIPTKKLYQLAFQLLRQRSKHLAARYRLKRAIMDLGPSGFPFERFVARLLSHEGYRVVLGTVAEGRCVKHEIDVIAQRNGDHFMVECKYHNQPGKICDVKIPLYIQARFQDVMQQWRSLPDHVNLTHQGWVMTNTRFSADALQYGQCAGLKLTSWDHPVKGSLKDRIDRSGLYPITCLGTITHVEKQRILELGIVLCREIDDDHAILAKAGIRPPRTDTVLEEIAGLTALIVEQG